MGISNNALNEIEQERASYLLNLDDMNYAMLAELTLPGNKYDIPLDRSNIMELEKINLIGTIIGKEDAMQSMELIKRPGEIEFPKKKFHPLRPATLENEIAEDTSYSE